MNAPGSINPRLSVILPVRNEAKHIVRVLDGLLDQTLPHEAFELLVVDGQSTDGTRDLVANLSREHANIKLLDNPALRSGPARNIGVAASRSPYVVFVDGHCQIISRSFLEDTLAAFTAGARCISRPQPMMPKPGHPFQEAVALARRAPLGHYAGSKIYKEHNGWCSPLSAGCGYAKDLYEELGGVDETFDAAEDLEFNLRVAQRGIQAKHSKAFAVGYIPRSGWRSLFRQIYRYGFGRARMACKHRSSLSLLVCFLALLVAVMIILPLAALWQPAVGRVWITVAGSYLGLIALLSVIGARNRPALTIKVFTALIAIHLGGGLGYLAGLLNGPAWSKSQLTQSL